MLVAVIRQTQEETIQQERTFAKDEAKQLLEIVIKEARKEEQTKAAVATNAMEKKNQSLIGEIEGMEKEMKDVQNKLHLFQQKEEENIALMQQRNEDMKKKTVEIMEQKMERMAQDQTSILNHIAEQHNENFQMKKMKKIYHRWCNYSVRGRFFFLNCRCSSFATCII